MEQTLKPTKKYIISPVTSYDQDEELWFTKVGTNGKDMPLLFISAGKTKEESQENANRLVRLLNRN